MSKASMRGGVALEEAWRLSASLETVRRGDSDVVLVTSLEKAVRSWTELDTVRRGCARLTPDRTLNIDGAEVAMLSGNAIEGLARHLYFD